jgi:hypothetical protein
MKGKITAAVLFFLLLLSTYSPVYLPASTTTLHYTANEEGYYLTTTSLGYNLHDTEMDASTINALPSGTMALVWAENGRCPTTLSSTFIDFVVAQATNPKIYGYYLVDEPEDPSTTCVNGIKAMADYIHTKAPGKKAMILLTDYPGTYAAYAPANSHVDVVALDPYPCHSRSLTCDFVDIDAQVNAAINAGIQRSVIVPTFQLFGRATSWRSPSTTELKTILARWSANVPNPPFDYSYSWGCQGGYLSDCLSKHTDWQDVMKSYFSTGKTLSLTPTPLPLP